LKEEKKNKIEKVMRCNIWWFWDDCNNWSHADFNDKV